MLIGWRLLEWPDVLVEAELHAVWVGLDQEYVDVSPSGCGSDNILFLPDPTRSYDGKQVNNIRMPISCGSYVKRFIDAADRVFLVTNSGDRARIHGELKIPAAEFGDSLHEYRQLRALIRSGVTGPNARCHCGSGVKYKRCHGTALRPY